MDSPQKYKRYEKVVDHEQLESIFLFYFCAIYTSQYYEAHNSCKRH